MLIRRLSATEFSLAVPRRPAPGGQAPIGDHGHPRATFHRAIERGNYLIAITTAREIGRRSLDEALELLILIALHQPGMYDRAAHRWLRRLLEERADLTVVDMQLVAASLAGLPTPSHNAAAGALRCIAKP